MGLGRIFGKRAPETEPATDEQAAPEFHGGPDKAVYAYAREDVEWWEREVGREFEHGVFGENLTVSGVDVTGAVVGERWEIGTAVFEVAQPRIPCWKLGARMNDASFPVHFAAAGRPGAYLRIVQEGEIGAGDEIRVGDQVVKELFDGANPIGEIRVGGKPEHGLTVGDVARIYHQERGRCRVLLDAPELAEEWKDWALRRTGDRVG